MRYAVLIVDENEKNREHLCNVLEDDYDVIEAKDLPQFLGILEKRSDEIGVILMELSILEHTGFSVLDSLKYNKKVSRVPIVIISSDGKIDMEEKCIDGGASDVLRRPFSDKFLVRRIASALVLFQYQLELEGYVEKQNETLKKQYRILRHQANELKKSNTSIIEILGTVVECRNLESNRHVRRVKGFTRILAEEAMKQYPEYGLTQEKIDVIVMASALHDVGKIAIPDSILLKPGKLTKDEFEYMKSHTTRGGAIIKQIRGSWDEEYGRVSMEICRHHHEKYDGKGYPDGLAGENIPISAQLVSIADVYDSLVSERVYKSAYSYEEAFHMVVNGECGIFSPKLMECFRSARERFEEFAMKNS